jgi:hypothetical protein
MDLTIFFEVILAVGGSLGVMLGIIFVLGLLVQTVTEFLFGKIEGILTSIFPKLLIIFSKTSFRTGLIALFSVGLGFWAAFLYQLDLVYLIGALFASLTAVDPVIQTTILGLSITAVVIGMGASYINDLIVKPLLSHFKPKVGDGPTHAG